MSETKPAWEQVTVGALGRDKIERLTVPGGWLYRNASSSEGGMTFVPTPTICSPECLRLTRSPKLNVGEVQ